MKMHFSIPVSEQLLEKFGGRYVLYSVYLEGFLFCKVRYSQLHYWNDQLRRIFGSTVPAFPPKFYLAMTKSMAEERRSQLEQYLQSVTVDPSITNSDVFISFFRKLQQDTFQIQTQRASLDVYLADGRNVRLDIQTSDTAERVLEVMVGFQPIRLICLFCFFPPALPPVVKKVAEFELPYVSLQSMKESDCKIGIRKWYMDPSLDKMLMDCGASVNLLYMQLLDHNCLCTEDHVGHYISSLSNSVFLMQVLELVQEVQHYGYIQLDPCTCDYPEIGCSAAVHVGNNEISCSIKLPSNQTKEVSFKINRVRSWQVTFLGAITQPKDQGHEQTLELRFEYNDSDSWRWIVFYTKQVSFRAVKRETFGEK
uniref:Sorting nexin 31 n=1 Tax=Chelonoidis abingdonii TaxID=106734 RepID=A0A8C0GMW6_CHEAB